MLDAPDVLEGSCLCGRVRYRVRGPWGEMDNCHCVDCRKSHGAAFATYIEARRDQFAWLSGEENLTTYTAATGTRRAFCKSCGSNLTCFVDADADMLEVACGTLDTPLPLKPRSHIFVRSKAPWYEILDGAPQFRTYRDAQAE